MITLLAAILVLVWARLRGIERRALGLVVPERWPPQLVAAIVAGGALKLAMKAVVMPLLGAPIHNRAYSDLIGNTALLPVMLFIVIFGAGFGEELLWRGFLFERLRRWWGASGAATMAIVAVTSVLFGLAHLVEQGVPGAQQATITGLVFGAVYARTGSLFVPMIAHAAFDVVAVAILYFDLEEAVARSVFG